MRAALLALTLLTSTCLRAVEVPPIITEWIAAQQHMGDIKVPFKLTRTLPTMKDPIVASGQFWRLADGRFRWEVGSPASTVLLFDNTDLHLWDDTQKQWQTLSPNEGRMRMWMHFLNSKAMNGEDMVKNFTPTITGQTKEVVTIALQPKGLIVRKHLKQVDLQIDPTTKYLIQIRLIQSDDATLLMSFADPQNLTEAAKGQLQFTSQP